MTLAYTAHGEEAARTTLDGARLRFERIMTVVRIVFFALLVVILLSQGISTARRTLLLVADSACLIACLGLGVYLWRAEHLPRGLLIGSVVVDYVAIAMSLGSIPVLPHDDGSWLRLPETGFLFLGATLVGLRIDKQIAAVGVTAYAALGAWLIASAAWVDHDMWWRDGVYVALGVFAGTAVGLTISYAGSHLVRESAERAILAERARQRLGIYVSEEIADLVLEAGALERGGSRQKVAVLFSDIRGFSGFAESRDPEAVVNELNDYLEAMVACIREEGGVVDKYIGDAIMAVFGIPKPVGDEATRAIRAAFAMQEALDRHNKTRAARGLPPMAQGVGVHYGTAVAGNVGTPERLQFTVIGDAVNLASRLEGLTKDLDTGMVISAAAVQASGESWPLERREAVEVRGRVEPVDVYVHAPRS